MEVALAGPEVARAVQWLKLTPPPLTPPVSSPIIYVPGESTSRALCKFHEVFVFLLLAHLVKEPD